MKILAVGYKFLYKGLVLPNYFLSMCSYLKSEGHIVDIRHPADLTMSIFKQYDFVLNVDSGRNEEGVHSFIDYIPPIPSAVYFIDSHGQPDLHKSLANNFNHVFFAVWNKRDLFDPKKSSWLPNFTDLHWFSKYKYDNEIKYDFGFFGTKMGLARAEPLKEICDKLNLSYDIRQINKPWKPRWPHTAEAMSVCRYFYNRGQKHDGPNLRVLESMAMGRPLLTDLDPSDGMSKIFEEGKHFIGYKRDNSDLEDRVKFIVDPKNKQYLDTVADAAYEEVEKNHTVTSRVKQILETIKDL